MMVLGLFEGGAVDLEYKGREYSIFVSDCKTNRRTEEDKTVVGRARKAQRFLSQPFEVAEQFTGHPGKYVPLKETIRGFGEIIEGKHDEIPESYFLFAGSIDEVVEKWQKNQKQ